MKKLLILLFLLPFSLLAQKMNGVYTRSELTTQKPPQCTTCLVIEGDSVGLFVYDKNDDSSLASADIIVNTQKNWRWKRARYAGAINFGNASYYTKAQLDPILNIKINSGNPGPYSSNYITMYGSNNSLYASTIFQANGKIGINTSNPEVQLHVNGDAKVRTIKSWMRHDIEGAQIGGDENWNLAGITFGNWMNPTGSVPNITGGSVGDWNMDDPYMYLRGKKGVVISSGNDNFGNTAGIFVDTLRRVGIRRTTPTYTLDVGGTMRSDSNTYVAAVTGGLVVGTAAYDGYKLDVTGWTRTKNNTFLATNDGSVGVGTITPTTKLEIKSPSAEIVRINTSTTSQQGYIGFSENGTLKQSLGLQTDNTFFLYDNVYARDMIKTTGAGNISFVPGSGSVGVGTTSPLGTLHLVSSLPDPFFIEQTSTTGYAQTIYKGTAQKFQTGVGGGSETTFGVANKFFVYDGTAGFMRLVIDPAGKVGIGTSNPIGRLDVQTPLTSTTPFSNLIARVASNATNADATINFTDNATYNSYIGAGGGSMYFATNGSTERMRIDPNGRVGIGTATPAAKLDVNGTMVLTPVSAATASGYIPAEGQIVIVNTTNGTFTSLGLWSYANGAWRK
ncbi:hypothetical protein GVN20_05725 [Runella sp. CRIBMP]|uniref:hypothetical protein n=1 Tax=Runella sp. CRIBMP TaxID=2683261 RepID=UPI001412FB31|nr:hypothetical protein [Runella sp. CRIBMP]NBB18849.1 hypothetical protein [Runella sp. CRIBMP]